MNRTIPAVVVLGVALAAITGCDSGPRPPAGIGQDPVTAAVYPNITVDGELQRFIKVDYDRIVYQAPTGERPIFVQVPARSQADNEFAIQYNFEFFSADGLKVGETGYKTAVFPSRRQQLLTGNAITSRATAWRLDVRSAR